LTWIKRQHAPCGIVGQIEQQRATTPEWTLSSPPPFHQFSTLPRIATEAHQ
jgi:hypothetical protein